MGGHHHHHRGHSGSHSSTKNIGIALVLNFVFSLIEIVGGLWTGSVAILTDALHDLGDCLTLAVALVLEKMAQRGSTEEFSYGYRRLSLLSAFITGVLLVAGSVFILTEAVPRLWAPAQPHAGGMIGLAVLGVAVNGYAALRVMKGSSANERAISWHMLEDVFGWVAVLIGAIVMYFFELPIIDPILSVVFTCFILYNVTRGLRETFQLFLQGVPRGVETEGMLNEMRQLDGVTDLHDVHLWSLDGDSHVLTMHVVMEEDFPHEREFELKCMVRKVASKYGKIHVTTELEAVGEDCPDIGCVPS